MHSIFGPVSPQAAAVTHLWWWMFGAGLFVWIAVTVLALWAAAARSAAREADGLMHVAPATHRRAERIVSGGIFATVLILAAFLAYDFSVGRALAVHPARALTIRVTGHQWWWDAVYEDSNPSRQVETANEIHVPVGEPVQVELRAADVIHSFWAPSLNGKRDLVPGYTSTLWFRADTAGTYRGQCAEFCGLQHAKMAFYIVAEPREKFLAWLAAASTPPAPPVDSAAIGGRRVFMSSGCSLCHAIGGTDARGTIGPTLTHLTSRATLAAGALANTPANLARWIRDPNAIKPGVHMPAIPLNDAQLGALVSYLETLK